MKHILYFILLNVVVLGAHAQTEPRLVLPIGHTSAINSAVFSPDGKYALTASRDNTARIYEVASGKELQVLSGHTDRVDCAFLAHFS